MARGWAVRRWAVRLVAMVLFCAFVLPVLLIGVYRFVPPPGTPLMVIRMFEGQGVQRQWMPLAEISPHLIAAVVSAEDARFCSHYGIDLVELTKAYEVWRSGGALRGASTISMQTARNLFLWPGGDYDRWLRKGLEVWSTGWLEFILPKNRILELYLNIIEWGPGVYGAGAAAQSHYGVDVGRIGPDRAARLAAVLPNPRIFDPRDGSGRAARHAPRIKKWASQLAVGPDGTVC